MVAGIATDSRTIYLDGHQRCCSWMKCYMHTNMRSEMANCPCPSRLLVLAFDLGACLRASNDSAYGKPTRKIDHELMQGWSTQVPQVIFIGNDVMVVFIGKPSEDESTAGFSGQRV